VQNTISLPTDAPKSQVCNPGLLRKTALAGRSSVVWLCETTAQITEDLSLWKMAINFSTGMMRDSFDGTSFG
jgi:hypothetical protein